MDYQSSSSQEDRQGRREVESKKTVMRGSWFVTREKGFSL